MQQPAPRRLTRSADRRLGGVCGGIAEYFGIDPTLVRVVAVILLLFGPVGGVTFLGYLVLWVVLPGPADGAVAAREGRAGGDAGFVVGMSLLVIGAWLLVGRMGWMGMGWMPGWLPGVAAGPLLLVALGLAVIMLSRRPSR